MRRKQPWEQRRDQAYSYIARYAQDPGRYSAALRRLGWPAYAVNHVHEVMLNRVSPNAHGVAGAEIPRARAERSRTVQTPHFTGDDFLPHRRGRA